MLRTRHVVHRKDNQIRRKIILTCMIFKYVFEIIFLFNYNMLITFFLITIWLRMRNFIKYVLKSLSLKIILIFCTHSFLIFPSSYRFFNMFSKYVLNISIILRNMECPMHVLWIKVSNILIFITNLPKISALLKFFHNHVSLHLPFHSCEPLCNF